MVRAFDFLIQSLIIRGLKTHLQRLDNYASLALRNYLTKQGINYQLVPPHIHQKTTQNEQYKHSRIMLLPVSAQWVQLFH
jgi:hypothetical protein